MANIRHYYAWWGAAKVVDSETFDSNIRIGWNGAYQNTACIAVQMPHYGAVSNVKAVLPLAVAGTASKRKYMYAVTKSFTSGAYINVSGEPGADSGRMKYGEFEVDFTTGVSGGVKKHTLNILVDNKEASGDIFLFLWTYSHSMTYTELTGAASVDISVSQKSTLNVSNGVLGTEQTISAVSSVSGAVHTLKWTSGSHSGTIDSGSSKTSWKWTPAIGMAAYKTDGTSFKATITLETRIGSTLVGSDSKEITLTIPDSVKPTVSIGVSNASDPGGVYVQGKSKVTITLTETQAYGSAIQSRSITFDGKSYTSSPVTTSEVSGSGTMTITASVTDSRGRTGTATKTISVAAYTAPRITASAVRCDQDGTADKNGEYMKVSYSITTTFSASSSIKRRKSSVSSWTTESIGSGTSISGSKIYSAEKESSYVVLVTAADSYGSTEFSVNVPSVSHWLDARDGNGLTLGGAAEEDGLVCKWPAKFPGGVTAISSPVTNATDTPSTWAAMKNTIALFPSSVLKNQPTTRGIVQSFTDGTNVSQIYVSLTNGAVYSRYGTGSSFGSWTKL